jgi:hypothetical protein
MKKAIQSHSERPNVRLRTRDSVLPKFKRQVVVIPGTNGVAVQQFVRHKTEVPKARNAVFVYQDVSRLDVTVDHPARV